jgi:hypothetical protein
MNTPHTQLPENCIVVDKEMLEEEMKKLVDKHNATDDEEEKSYLLTKYSLLQSVIDNSYPLTPIRKDAWESSSMFNSYLHKPITEEKWVGVIPKDRHEYLSQPITLKKAP